MRAETDAEILERVAVHAREVHGHSDVNDDVVARVLSVITVEPAAR